MNAGQQCPKSDDLARVDLFLLITVFHRPTCICLQRPAVIIFICYSYFIYYLHVSLFYLRQIINLIIKQCDHNKIQSTGYCVNIAQHQEPNQPKYHTFLLKYKLSIFYISKFNNNELRQYQ